MRARSLKTQRRYRERRKIVARLFDGDPLCQRCSSAYATDPHELLPRGRGGSITDPENIALLCRPCHDGVTFHTVPDWRDWIRTSDGRGHVAWSST